MKTKAQVIRTKNFVDYAAAFILEQARKAIVERNEFKIALSGGNTPPRFTLGLRRRRMIFRGSWFASLSETSVVCRRMIRKATSEWRAKIFLCLLPFLRNQSCACAAKLIRKSRRRNTKTS